ncbi:hypothetical protein IWQ60_010113 [Tieghemiomyces parasiticus]|uniref:Palmitoyltransferase n=1 Tax=Tieghemiomyces parasiticus TaxID=78921 RepID=A0A9W7ZRH2_9FUNG|nr:hypothetical protein IWQ60_010113 [Tieghemiomyces parasiticus]
MNLLTGPSQRKASTTAIFNFGLDDHEASPHIDSPGSSGALDLTFPPYTSPTSPITTLPFPTSYSINPTASPRSPRSRFPASLSPPPAGPTGSSRRPSAKALRLLGIAASDIAPSTPSPRRKPPNPLDSSDDESDWGYDHHASLSLVEGLALVDPPASSSSSSTFPSSTQRAQPTPRHRATFASDETLLADSSGASAIHRHKYKTSFDGAATYHRDLDQHDLIHATGSDSTVFPLMDHTMVPMGSESTIVDPNYPDGFANDNGCEAIPHRSRFWETPIAGDIQWQRRHGFQPPYHPYFFIQWTFCVLIFFGEFLYSARFIDRTTRAFVAVYVVGIGISLTTGVLNLLASYINPTDPVVTRTSVPRNLVYRMVPGILVNNLSTGVCDVCQVQVAFTTRHCKRCNRCVSGFDHHCKWLNTCIGTRNYRVFIVLLLVGGTTGLLYLANSAYIIYLFFAHKATYLERVADIFDLDEPHPAATSGPVIAADVVVAVLAFANWVAVSAVAQILMFHIKLSRQGKTTVEYLNEMDDQRYTEFLDSQAARAASQVAAVRNGGGGGGGVATVGPSVAEQGRVRYYAYRVRYALVRGRRRIGGWFGRRPARPAGYSASLVGRSDGATASLKLAGPGDDWLPMTGIHTA